MKKYTAKNIYGINGESTHKTPETALKAASKREGDGWVVVDDDGNQYDFDFDHNAVITRGA